MSKSPAPARVVAHTVLLAATSWIPLTAVAQQSITVPRISPPASVSQTVGLNRIAIEYHRPAVNARKIWGSLVPYGQVWRAGANDNTTVSFSHPARVGGHAVAAGIYGLHMIPTATDWTIILSHNSTSWGSFTYDDKEDAARFTVTPTAAAHEERLVYGFSDPSETSTTAYLHWEKLLVSFPIEVDTPEQVLANAELQLRHLQRFSWQGWMQAAAYAEQHNVRLDDAMQWIDRSLRNNRNFQNMNVEARLLDRLGRSDEASAVRTAALDAATEAELNNEGYRLLGLGKDAEALALFERNADRHPESWNVHDSLAECIAKSGDSKRALQIYQKALSLAPDDQKARIESVLKGLGS